MIFEHEPPLVFMDGFQLLIEIKCSFMGYFAGMGKESIRIIKSFQIRAAIKTFC